MAQQDVRLSPRAASLLSPDGSHQPRPLSFSPIPLYSSLPPLFDCLYRVLCATYPVPDPLPPSSAGRLSCVHVASTHSSCILPRTFLPLLACCAIDPVQHARFGLYCTVLYIRVCGCGSRLAPAGGSPAQATQYAHGWTRQRPDEGQTTWL